MSRFYSETEVVARVEGLTVARLRAFVAAGAWPPPSARGGWPSREDDLARARLLAELGGRLRARRRGGRPWCCR